MTVCTTLSAVLMQGTSYMTCLSAVGLAAAQAAALMIQLAALQVSQLSPQGLFSGVA